MVSRSQVNSRTCQRGFNFVFLLFFVAITSAALAALGRSWSLSAQRERERELVFRGEEIVKAIASYRATTPAGTPPRFPESFDDLLEDKRGPVPIYHLRRLYVDPFTLQADWTLLPAPAGMRGFVGVRSTAEVVLLKQAVVDRGSASRASDRVFVVRSF